MKARVVHTTLNELIQLQRRIEPWALDARDGPVIGALVAKEIAHVGRRQARMADKAAEEAELEGAEVDLHEPTIDADYSVAHAEEEGASQSARVASTTETLSQADRQQPFTPTVFSSIECRIDSGIRA